MLDNRDKIIKDGNDIMSKENLLLFNAYRRRLKKRKLEFDTIYAYERDIKMWFTFLHTRQDNLMAYEVTAEDLEEYFEYCKNEEGNGCHRLRRKKASVNSFLNYLRKRHMIDENPMYRIVKPSSKYEVAINPEFTLSRSEIEVFKSTLEDFSMQAKAFGLLSLSTGGRAKLIAALKWSEIDLKNRIIRTRQDFSGRPVKLYFSEEVADVIQDLKLIRASEGIGGTYVFCTKVRGKAKRIGVSTLRGYIAEVGRTMGKKGLCSNMLRNTNAYLLYEGGLHSETINYLLNQSDVDNEFKLSDKEIIQFKDEINL